MTKNTKTRVIRKPWVKPIVHKIAAGQAENFANGNQSDGAFTTS